MQSIAKWKVDRSSSLQYSMPKWRVCQQCPVYLIKGKSVWRDGAVKVPDALPNDSSLVPDTHAGQLIGLQVYSGHLEEMEELSVSKLCLRELMAQRALLERD